MSVKKYKYDYRGSASKLHKLVGDILRSHKALKNFRSLQEYPIPHTLYHVDWYLIDFNLAIELHGEQHYMPVCFGGITKEEAQKRFLEQQQRDLKKQALCEDQKWKYLAIPYTVTDPEQIGKLIIDAMTS
jgi:very-short-patch-repair endonuclease